MERGEIYFADIDKLGNVQTGRRPVIIIQNNKGNQYSPTTIVATITAQPKKPIPTHVDIFTNGGLLKNSTILCEQILTINKSSISDYIGRITNPRILKQLDKSLRISLGIGEIYD